MSDLKNIDLDTIATQITGIPLINHNLKAQPLTPGTKASTADLASYQPGNDLSHLTGGIAIEPVTPRSIKNELDVPPVDHTICFQCGQPKANHAHAETLLIQFPSVAYAVNDIGRPDPTVQLCAPDAIILTGGLLDTPPVLFDLLPTELAERIDLALTRLVEPKTGE